MLSAGVARNMAAALGSLRAVWSAHSRARNTKRCGLSSPPNARATQRSLFERPPPPLLAATSPPRQPAAHHIRNLTRHAATRQQQWRATERTAQQRSGDTTPASSDDAALKRASSRSSWQADQCGSIRGRGAMQGQQEGRLLRPSEPLSWEDLDVGEERRSPARKIALAVFLFAAGTALLATGVGLWGSQRQTATALLVLGSVCFVPGAYHTRIAVLALQGRRGFSLAQIPDF